MARTIEELKLGFERIAAAQACRNLMGKYSYYHTAMRNKDYVQLWADREDDLLVMPWGYYQGIEGVRKCYLQDHGDRNDPEIQDSPILKGGMMMHCVDTEVLEVAGDGKTAKGCWISPGHESCFFPGVVKIPGWMWGVPVPPDAPRVAAGAWPLYKTDFYVPWTQHPDMDPVDFPFHNHKPLPQPNWAWSMDAVYPADEPEPPLPYEHYEDAVPALWANYQ